MSKLYIGFDNGVTGSIGIVGRENGTMLITPVKKELSYTKKKQNITRIDVVALEILLNTHCFEMNPHAMIERPLVNPGMFKATLSAMRALEATLNVLELLRIGYEYIDSKEWQKALLPQGIKGTAELKKASAQVATRLYPHLSEVIAKQKDGDGILIAHYLMLKYTNPTLKK